MNNRVATWEGEGGAVERIPGPSLIGTVNQIAWAEKIKVQVDAEFDRVRRALQSVASRRSRENGRDLQAIIRLLEEKRAEVMANEQAGYFIHDWQELRDQVRQLIVCDSRYKPHQG